MVRKIFNNEIQPSESVSSFQTYCALFYYLGSSSMASACGGSLALMDAGEVTKILI